MTATHIRRRSCISAAQTDDELFAAWAEDRDPAVRAQLVERFLPLARKLAVRYSYTHEPLEDLVQVASLGLLKALDRFDPTRGSRFVSFAAPTILGELKRHFRDRGWAIHVPRELQERALTVGRHVEQLSGTLGRQPTVLELADSMQCGVEDVTEALQALRGYDTASLDAPVASEDAQGASLGDTLGSLESGYELAESRELMQQRWRSLSDLERQVVSLRLQYDLTQREIGARTGYSQMHICRLLRRSLKRLEIAGVDGG